MFVKSQTILVQINYQTKIKQRMETCFILCLCQNSISYLEESAPESINKDEKFVESKKSLVNVHTGYCD